MPVAELRIPPDPSYVGLARLVVAQAARQAGVADERVQDVKIAVAEALASAVRQQATLESSAPIDLTFGVTEVGFEVAVMAREGPATPVDPAAEPGPHLVDPELSLTIIEGLTDKMTHESDDSIVCVRFVVAIA
ncbi:MAG TPA: ATP-binding protein [Euzebyales bacterium]|nr:ATP-binding protein [Euzebyales bacterium]